MDDINTSVPLVNNYVNGVVDYKGRPVLRSKSGCWRSAYFIISVEVAERFASNGISSNLITYLTGPLGQSTATAAENVNLWNGTVFLLPFVGAFIADGFLGRYLTIVIASLIYVPALVLLAFSTMIPSDCQNANDSSLCSPRFKDILFFISLYLVAFAQGGHKPCIQAFGADQFDADNIQERKAKSSFFNWWYLGLCVGATLGNLVLSYVQDNLSWALGFGISSIVVGFTLLVFLSGTMTYRFEEKTEKRSPFVRISQVFIKAAQNWQIISAEDQANCRTLLHRDFQFLDKAMLSHDDLSEDGTACSTDEVEDAKSVLRLVPIWVSCLGYAVVFSQASTLFIKQGATLDRLIGLGFEVPAAALQSFITLFVIILIPVYDAMLVPLMRAITKKPSGITMLQRIGTGIVISSVSMIIAAVIETKRLSMAREYGLVDEPSATIPMKIWWLLPQCLLTAAGEIFTIVGMQEFFYEQMPNDLKSIGLAVYLSVLGIGSFLSSFLILIVEKLTSGNDQDGWIADNMNQGHIDYFYYLLAGFSAGVFVVYVYIARSYIYN